MREQRWEQWIDSERNRSILRAAKERLKAAWRWDSAVPKSYPMNTSFALAEILESLSKVESDQKNHVARVRIPDPPKTFAELIPEKVLKAVWEEHHSGNFEDGLKQAADVDYEDQKKSWKAFQGILRAIEITYLGRFYNIESMPRPKVNILHKGLIRIANAAGLEDLTEEGFAEFLDDLCPCGIKNHKEAHRKLSSRSPRMRRRIT